MKLPDNYADKFTVEEKSPVEHQQMMGRIKDVGWLTGAWVARWGRWIKQSGISDYDLDRLIRYSLALPKQFNPRGFVRNRLRDRDWHKYDLPK